MLEPTFAVAPLVVKPINDLYDFIKDKITQKFDERAIKKVQSTLTERIESVQKVKTIYKGDSAINLKEFYYPTKIKFNSELKQISSIGDIPTSRNIVLQGTAGQGKSVFMRFMTSQEIRKQNRIPVFFELRNLLKDESLEHALISTLGKWLFEIDSHAFKILAESGKLVLFLDGFDEISSEYVKSVIRELEHWTEQYPDLQIIISSRPESGIESSNFFEVIPLQPYGKDDQLGLIRKLIEDDENFLQVKNALEASSMDIQNLLKTPLIVTLFVMTYRAKQIIPESMSDFYEDIFQVLMHRHDKTKPGFTRELKSSLNEKQLQEVFETFCFLSKKENLLSFKRQKFIDLLKLSLEKSNHLNQDPTKVLNDITKCLCLIIQDGIEYSFIHKSIQEFFVANFIKNLPESLSEKMYQNLSFTHDDYKVELKFLELIDRYRYYKFLFVPEMTMALKEYGITQKLNLETLANKVYILRLPNYFSNENENESLFVLNSTYCDFDNMKWGVMEIFFIVFRVHFYLDDYESKPGRLQKDIESSYIIEKDTLNLRDAIKSSKYLKNIFLNMLNELEEANIYIKSKEDSSLFDF